MTSRLARIGAFFLEPADAAPPAPDPDGSAAAGAPPVAPGFATPVAADAHGSATAGAPEPAKGWTRAVVLGVHVAVVPVAAACAGELRARDRAAAAALCVWRPRGAAPEQDAAEPDARPPAGATTPGARRLAARLAAQGLEATACGRLAWLALDADPAAALDQARRCLRAAAAPVVLAVAGPRPAAFEPFLAELDLALAVLPADADPALRALTLGSLAARDRMIVPPLPPGPSRWAAMAGLARLRALPAEGAAS